MSIEPTKEGKITDKSSINEKNKTLKPSKMYQKISNNHNDSVSKMHLILIKMFQLLRLSNK